MHPAASPGVRFPSLASCGLPPRLTAVLQQQYNASQQAAVAASAARKQDSPFTLVQVGHDLVQDPVPLAWQ